MECKAGGCTKPSWQTGYCMMHYQRVRRYGTLYVPEKKIPIRRCKVKDCDGIHSSLGYCEKHYARIKRNGTLEIKSLREHPEECSFDGCLNKYHAKGLCLIHYNYWLTISSRKQMIEDYGVYIDPKRLRLLNYLGGRCNNCGFDQFPALQIDHINGGGCEERRRFKHNQTMIRYYSKHLEEAKYKLQILCANCNVIKSLSNEERRRHEIDFFEKLDKIVSNYLNTSF